MRLPTRLSKPFLFRLSRSSMPTTRTTKKRARPEQSLGARAVVPLPQRRLRAQKSVMTATQIKKQAKASKTKQKQAKALFA
nr:MAG TPA: hypothetical protein [Caudoviricetes sp.]